MLEEAATSRVAGATAVGDRWRQMETPFLVLHGLEGYPDQLGRDLDTLMDQSLADAALREAATTLSGLGWQSVRPPDLWGKRLVALRSIGKGEFDYLEFHTMDSVRWLVLPLVEPSETPSHEVGPFHASYWATFMKAMVSPVLAGDLARFTPEYLDRHFRSGIRPEVVESRCRTYFGSELGGALMQGLENRDPNRFIESTLSLRRFLIRRMLKRPWSGLHETPAFLRKRVLIPFSRSGLHIELNAPQTAQTESLVNLLITKLSNVFVEIDVRDRYSRRRTGRDRRRLQARQGLAIDLMDVGSAEAGLKASIRPQAVHPKFVAYDLKGDLDSDVSELANWIVDAWIEKLTGRHSF